MKTKPLLPGKNIVYDDLLLLMNSIQDYAIIRLDIEGNITSWNKGAEQIKGYTSDEITGKNFSIFYLATDVATGVPHANLNLAKAKGSYTGTGWRARKDGSAFWADMVITALYTDDGNLRGFVKITRDITKQKEMSDELERLHLQAQQNITETLNITLKENTDYKHALDESAIIAITDQKGIIFYVNDNFCKISKYSRKELIGQDHRIINSGYHDKTFIRNLWVTIAAGKIWKGEIKNKAKDGSYYWVDATIIPFLNKDGKPYQYVAIRSDITERKKAELVAVGALAEKNTILESIGDAFFAVDKNWTVTYWNNTAEKVLMKTKSEMINNNLWEVFSDSIGSKSYKKYHEAIETNQVIRFEDYYAPLIKWYEISAYPSGDGLSVYFKDITERKLADIKLNDLNRHLQKQTKELAISNAELEQFAYVASHDLQEPLRMVTSFLSQIEKKYGEVLDDKGKQYIYFAVDGAKRMRQIILDLLEFSRVGQAGEATEEVDLNKLINDILPLYRKQIEERKAIITVAKLPTMQTDKVPIRQVFQNLISNALKYVKPDVHPVISIQCKEDPGYYEFSVKDNGIGIDPEYFDKIFIIFQRLHNKDEYSGTGMGLAVTKKIIENLGGKIWLKSEEGKGCTFYFTILKK